MIRMWSFCAVASASSLVRSSPMSVLDFALTTQSEQLPTILAPVPRRAEPATFPTFSVCSELCIDVRFSPKISKSCCLPGDVQHRFERQFSASKKRQFQFQAKTFLAEWWASSEVLAQLNPESWKVTSVNSSGKIIKLYGSLDREARGCGFCAGLDFQLEGDNGDPPPEWEGPDRPDGPGPIDGRVTPLRNTESVVPPQKDDEEFQFTTIPARSRGLGLPETRARNEVSCKCKVHELYGQIRCVPHEASQRVEQCRSWCMAQISEESVRSQKRQRTGDAQVESASAVREKMVDLCTNAQHNVHAGADDR